MTRPESANLQMENFEEYASRVLNHADELAKREIEQRADTAMAAQGINFIKSSVPVFSFEKSGKLQSKVSFYALGPSSNRSVRGVECTFAPDVDGYQKTLQHEWDYLEPQKELAQTTRITYSNVLSGDIFSQNYRGFGETDIRSIEDIIRTYEGVEDGQA